MNKNPLRNFSVLSPACQSKFYIDPKPTVQWAQYWGHELQKMHFFYREAEDKTDWTLNNLANLSQIYKIINLRLKYDQFNVNQAQWILLRLKHPFRVNESISNSRHGQYDITDMSKLI